MISFQELSEKTKNQIRSDEKLSEAFAFYFQKEFNQEPSFCCTFSDYTRLFNFQKTNTMKKSKKYKIDYPANFVLAYRKNKRTYRAMVKNATDEFLDDFLKYHAEVHFPNAKKHITLVEEPKKKVETPKADKNAKKAEK